MTNNDVLRRLRYTFDFDDDRMIAIFGLGGAPVTRAQVSDWLKRDDDPAFQECSDEVLATFLDGFITLKRGKQEGPRPAPEKRLNNNIILRKLRIALSYRDDDMLEVLHRAGMPLTKTELSAFFRKPYHKHYRACQDQILRRFLQGLQAKYRGEGGAQGGDCA